MNNEPVAYGMFVDGDFWDAIHPNEYHRIEGSYDTPLYTHPYERPHNTVLVPCDKLAEMQAEIERLTTKNLEWLANWNEQQAEIEALKAIINEAFKSIPAMGEDGEFYHEHHGMDGEYLGYENIPANYVVQVIEAILRKAQEK